MEGSANRKPDGHGSSFEHEDISLEEYARSLRAIRALGEASLKGVVLETEQSLEQSEAYVDFVSAVEENLATDYEYGKQLYFNPMRSHRYINGHVVDRTGRRMVDLIEDGRKASFRASLRVPEMAIQAERDECDVSVAQSVDQLKVGEMYVVVLMDPKSALRRNEAYWHRRGYRDGMAVLQVYYRNSEDEVIAGAHCIKDSDFATMRAQFAKYDVIIPTDESENRYARHAIQKRASRQEAQSFGKNFVDSYNAARGNAKTMVSTTQIIRDNQSLVRAYFKNFVQPMSEAYVSGESNHNLQQLAVSMLTSGSSDYDPAEKRSLMRVANGLSPNDDNIRFFEEKIRYALVEELRKLIPHYLADPSVPVSVNQSFRAVQYQDQITSSQHIAQNIHSGIQANRSYGGCASANTTTSNDSLADQLGTQDVFGGNGESLAEDRFGSRYFDCPKNGCRNLRPKNQLIPKCQKCGADVTCGAPKTAALKQNETRNSENKQREGRVSLFRKTNILLERSKSNQPFLAA